MKRMLMTAITVGLLVMMGRTWAYGQDPGTEPDLKAKIPFKFTVADTTLPAGEYMIKRLDDPNPNALELRNANDRIEVVFLTESAQADHSPAKSDLVFDKLGNRYFLSHIWVAGEKTGNRVIEPRAEQKLEKMGMKIERQAVDCQDAHHPMKKKRAAKG
jgi:hypothetical protein